MTGPTMVLRKKRRVVIAEASMIVAGGSVMRIFPSTIARGNRRAIAACGGSDWLQDQCTRPFAMR